MAATTVDELQVVIGANTNELRKELQSVSKQLSKFQGGFQKLSAKTATLAVAAGNIIANAFSAAFRAISQEMGEAVTRLDALNNYPKVMANLGISSEDAERSIQVLNNGILGLPTSLDQAALATQRLTATNGNIAASTDMFLALNNAILAGGASTEIQANALEQMMQAYSKGRPDAMEWRAFLTAMPAQLKQIATQMGYTSTALGGDLQKALVEGEVSMNDFMFAIMQLNKQGVNGLPSFAEQAKNAVNGVKTSVQNLKISIQRGLANIMDVIGQTNISGFINGIAAAFDKISYYVGGFVVLIKQAVAWVQALFGKGSGSTDELVKATSSASSSAGSFAENAGDAAEELDDATGSAKKLQKQLASFDEMNVLKEADASGGGSSSSGGGAGGAGIPDYSWGEGAFSNAADKMTQYAEKIKEKFKEIFGEIDVSKLGTSIVKLWNGIKKAINGALDAGRKFIDEFIVPLTKYALEDSIPRIFTAIGDALNGINFDKINNALGHVFGAMSNIGILFQDVIADIVERAAPIVEWLANFVVPPALEILATIINGIGAVLGGIWDALTEMYDQWLKPALDDLATKLEPILDFLNEMFGSVNEDDSAWETFRETVKTVVEVFIGPLIAALGLIIETIAILIGWINDAGTWVQNTANDIVTWVDQTAYDIGMFFGNAWLKIKETFSGIGQWFQERWNDVCNAFANVGTWFQDTFQGARDNVTNVFSNIGSWFNDRWTDVKNALSSVGTFFSDTFQKGWNGVKDAFNGIGGWFNDRWNDIKNVFSNVWNVFSDIGRNMWEGLKNGLGNIGKKVGDIFSNAVDWVKNAFGINSPSRVFKQFGGYIDEGFVLGIESGMSGVNQAMASLTDSFAMPDVSLTGSSTLGSGSDDNNAEKEPVQIVLNVGGEKLLDKLIDDINSRSQLENRFAFDI